MNPNLPEKIFAIMTYEQLRDQCAKITKFTDQEIAEKFAEEAGTSPTEIRKKYQFILEKITESDFLNLKHSHTSKRLKEEGNILFGVKNYSDAISKYEAAIQEASQITDQTISKSLIQALRHNLALTYNLMGLHDNAVSQCEMVLLYVDLIDSCRRPV